MIKSLNNLLKKLRLNLYFTNDLNDIDTVYVQQKVTINTQFSFSYVLLLITAAIVCTLGLLINSAPVVIGGMIISPLMWPLMKISFGLASERKFFILQGLHLLVLSILISFLGSVLITAISPLKILTSEIISRTTPTILDIFVALAAGAIAAFSIIQKRISDSLAGVAIATSLMPPLCVFGIGFALHDFKISYGGFLLFFSNVISIIFISVLIFTYIYISKEKKSFLRNKGILTIILVLIITSIPLVSSLKNYTFENRIYQDSKKIITEELQKLSSDITVENISTFPDRNNKDLININASIVSPENIELDYNKKEAIVAALENHFINKRILLNLKIQKTISIKSIEDVTIQNTKTTISKLIKEEFQKYSYFVVDDIKIENQNDTWLVNVLIRSEPNIVFSDGDRIEIQDKIKDKINQNVSLNLSIVPLIKLSNDNTLEINAIENDIESYIKVNFTNLIIKSINITSNNLVENVAPSYIVDVYVDDSANYLNTTLMKSLKAFLEEKFEIPFKVTFIVSNVTKYSY